MLCKSSPVKLDEPIRPSLGLRDRKRLETRHRLEEAATQLALSDGLEHATIQAICERAGVSTRTFFNYFESKEDAVLGSYALDLTPDRLAEHAARYDGADEIESIVGLVFVAFGPALTDAAAHTARMELARRYPELLGRRVEQMTRTTQELTAAVQATLHRSPRWAEHHDPRSAQMLLGICFTALRITLKEWVETDRPDTPDALKQRTITLIRQTTERLR